MAKTAKKKAKAPKPTAKAAEVESYKHKEAKRRNIPTAELQKLVPDDDKAIKKLSWARNPDLDPQLVWRGKDFEPDPLEVQGPPIYIQEKILPRVIVEDLRRQTKERRADDASQFDFFHDFNGLTDPEAKTDFYAHDQNWSNRMILGDSLLVMASLAEREGLRGKVQCIYFDPPYGIKFNSNWQPSTKSKDVRDGQHSAISREPEVIRAFRDTWKDGIHSYLSYLRDRLVIAHALLAESGSIFVQIGDENVHRVRCLLDEIFGANQFKAIVSYKRLGMMTGEGFVTTTHFIVWYTKSIDALKEKKVFAEQIAGVGTGDHYNQIENLETLEIRPIRQEERGSRSLTYGAERAFQLISLATGGFRANTTVNYTFRGETFHPGANKCWRTVVPGLDRLAKAERIQRAGRTLRYKQYLSDFPLTEFGSIWEDTARDPENKYVVQTPSGIIERCIFMTTDPGDLVLDPTCGSGTTAYVSEQWGRRWITIDTSRVALALARGRLMGAKYDYYLLRDSKEGAAKQAEITGKPPAEGPFTNNLRHGFVWERAPHVTLKSIANNAEIDLIWERWQKTLEPLREKLNKTVKHHWEEWQVPPEIGEKWSHEARELHAQWWEARRARQKEIDDSIGRNADVEYLYDRPYKARGVVRVAGPFTVESLSPHRVLPMGEDPYLEELLAAGEEEGVPSVPPALTLPRKRGGKTVEPASMVTTDFAHVVYENLKASGVQNTKKGETLKFEWLKPFASRSGLIQFEGRYQEKGESKRAAICIGPEYDTVGYDLVRRAAREAADLFDTLIICGFAFAPEVDETRLSFGALTVLKARMNQDLRMADKLKATGAGNLFVVFGEPDIVIHKRKGDMLQVEIRGMDIFDPTTGEVRSSGGKDLMNDVAAWFIDNDYDEESFFVRQAYFVGGDDPYEGLKRALKAEIDETAWAELNATISRPFRRPERGLVCVKAINHFGDEVQKVFRV
jgi:adenine-specific DNA-methyltransferase